MAALGVKAEGLEFFTCVGLLMAAVFTPPIPSSAVTWQAKNFLATEGVTRRVGYASPCRGAKLPEALSETSH